MKKAESIAVLFLCIFFVIVFAVAFIWYRHYPMLVIAGEESVATWMSGVLLVVSGTISILIGVHRKKIFWFAIASFFLLLACDERFMFHEQLKEKIIFSRSTNSGISHWVTELPVLFGACVGAMVTYLLWLHLPVKSRLLLILAALLGSASVIIDVLSLGV
ncbi:MAG TPA: hypothetical protein VGQ59_05240, partial [Cyclobacteriaceae bacterium]|nr:hypothetical protein [Cyclobacteriaceae bacterium]